MSTMNAISAVDVLGLLERQAALYLQLESHASRQRTLIAQEGTEPLLKLLAARQKLSVELTTIGKKLAPVRQAWDRFRQNLSEDRRSRVDALVEQTAEHLRRVMEIDERDVQLLGARKAMAARALRSTHVPGQALDAYRVPRPAAYSSGRLNEES